MWLGLGGLKEEPQKHSRGGGVEFWGESQRAKSSWLGKARKKRRDLRIVCMCLRRAPAGATTMKGLRLSQGKGAQVLYPQC